VRSPCRLIHVACTPAAPNLVPASPRAGKAGDDTRLADEPGISTPAASPEEGFSHRLLLIGLSAFVRPSRLKARIDKAPFAVGAASRAPSTAAQPRDDSQHGRLPQVSRRRQAISTAPTHTCAGHGRAPRSPMMAGGVGENIHLEEQEQEPALASTLTRLF
jgi:hypothetical protein